MASASRMILPDKLVLWEQAGFAMRRTYKETEFSEASCQVVLWDKSTLVESGRKDGEEETWWPISLTLKKSSVEH